MTTTYQAKQMLEANGYVVVKQKSYVALLTRLAVARAEARFERRERASQREWAEEMARESTRLRDRISFLYRTAMAFGASIDDLRGDPIER